MVQLKGFTPDLGYHSLFDYAVKSLGYSEDQAYRRIQAMRAIKEIPELAAKLNSGAISLTNLSMAQNVLKKNQKISATAFSKEQKLELFCHLENKSTREAEKILAQTMPESFVATKDRIHTNQSQRPS